MVTLLRAVLRSPEFQGGRPLALEPRQGPLSCDSFKARDLALQRKTNHFLLHGL